MVEDMDLPMEIILMLNAGRVCVCVCVCVLYFFFFFFFLNDRIHFISLIRFVFLAKRH